MVEHSNENLLTKITIWWRLNINLRMDITFLWSLLKNIILWFSIIYCKGPNKADKHTNKSRKVIDASFGLGISFEAS